MGQLDGKVALVTGASKGIGAEIAQQLASAGARVVVNYSSDRAGAERVVEEVIRAGGQAVALRADVSDPALAASLVAAAVEAYGRLDVLVNNAGVYSFQPLDGATPAEFHRIFNLNVLGLLMVTQAAVPHMPAGSSVINIGSGVARSPAPMAALYSASKAAVDALTIALAKELGARRIRVNSLNPGAVITEGSIAAFGADQPDNPMAVAMIGATPLGRLGLPGDIASVAVFLASDAAGWMTGEALFTAGGYR